MKYKTLLILLLLVFNCSKEQNVLKFDQFTIQVPNTWEKLTLEQIDSNIGGIITNRNDTLMYDFGFNVEDVEMEEAYFVFDSLEFKKMTDKEVFQKTKGVYIVVPTNEDKTKEINKIRDEQIHTYDSLSVNCFDAKLIRPKKVGQGSTGIYIKDFENGSGKKNISFSFYGQNLDSITQTFFIESIKTIKFNECTGNGTD